MKFNIKHFNEVINQKIQKYLISCYSIKFNIKYSNEIIKFIYYKTPLYFAIEKKNIEIVKLLLLNDKIDINFGYILKTIIIYKIENQII